MEHLRHVKLYNSLMFGRRVVDRISATYVWLVWYPSHVDVDELRLPVAANESGELWEVKTLQQHIADAVSDTVAQRTLHELEHIIICNNGFKPGGNYMHHLL
jgi:hypothetical protein